MIKLFLITSAVSGLLSVILGAFGAHGLKGKITDSLLATFQTGVHYQMIHTLALLGLGVLVIQVAQSSRWLTSAGLCWIAGILFFSGSLYWLALGGPRWLGPVTPLGGLLMMAGWVSLAVGVVKLRL